MLWGGGRLQGVSGAQHGLRYDRVGQCNMVKSEGRKGRERVAGKAAGDECVFIPSEGPGLADEFRSDAMPDRRGGR